MAPVVEHGAPLLPFQLAIASIHQWAQTVRLHRPTPDATHLCLRRRVRVRLDTSSPLDWLRVQHASQKLYYQCRDSSFEVAAVGFAHVATGDLFTTQVHSSLLSVLDPAWPDMRFYGAQRFDDGRTRPLQDVDPDWKPYGGYTYVLPLIELYRDSSSSDCYLACNLMSPSSRAEACQRLQALAPPLALTLSPLLPLAQSVENLTSFSHWDTSMTSILASIRRREYNKIVLARRKRFSFSPASEPGVLEILAKLVEPLPECGRSGGSSTVTDISESSSCSDHAPGDAMCVEDHVYSPADLRDSGEPRPEGSLAIDVERLSSRACYTFCLQLEQDQAFLGCTPERLFRVEGNVVNTHALAGTVRCEENEADNRQAISRLCNEKNREEHQIVVDYIREALISTGLEVECHATSVVQLPRLMHLATCMTGRTVQQSANGKKAPSAAALLEGKLSYRLVEQLHPTPAVCGMPRHETQPLLPGLEGFDRGLYSGPFGWFSHSSSDYCVALRCARVSGCEVTAYAGSGIVQASESRSEWDETELKMSPFTDMFLGDCLGGAPAHGRSSSVPMPRDGSQKSDCLAPQANGYPDVDDNKVDDDDDDDDDDNNNNNNNNNNSNSNNGNNNCNSKLSGPFSEVDNTVDCPDVVGSSCDEEAVRHTFFDPRYLDVEPNLNSLWGCSVIEELCRLGVTQYYVCPGSRSAPLAVGVVRCRHASMTIVHDERSAGFMAVGHARAARHPAAVITSSGTAVANLLPAVVEASNDDLPMLLLTADRPPELRGVSANQAIDQVKIFTSYVRWFKDVPCPTESIPLANLLSDMDYAVYRSLSSGPVHLNFMFREKLAPENMQWDRSYVDKVRPAWRNGIRPWTEYGLGFPSGADSLGSSQYMQVMDCFTKENKGLVLVAGGTGPAMDVNDQLAVLYISQALGWPIIADVVSGIRFGYDFPGTIGFADLFLESEAAQELLQCNAVLQFGARITSRRLQSFLASCENGLTAYVVASPTEDRIDERFQVTHRLSCRPTAFALQYFRNSTCFVEDGVPASLSNKSVPSEHRGKEDAADMDGSGSSRKLTLFQEFSHKMASQLDRLMEKDAGAWLHEPGLAWCISRHLPENCALFVGNSMPIRDLDMFARPERPRRIAANRGASGIDGVLSSAIGYAIGRGTRTCVVLGDMSFLHDLNALHALRTEESSVKCPPVLVVVVNNGGGGIFSLLPIANHPEVFSPVFDTPHAVRFEHVTHAFGIEYMAASTCAELARAIRQPLSRHRLVEAMISSNHAVNAQQRRGIVSCAVDRLGELIAASLLPVPTASVAEEEPRHH